MEHKIALHDPLPFEWEDLFWFPVQRRTMDGWCRYVTFFNGSNDVWGTISFNYNNFEKEWNFDKLICPSHNKSWLIMVMNMYCKSPKEYPLYNCQRRTGQEYKPRHGTDALVFCWSCICSFLDRQCKIGCREHVASLQMTAP